MEAGDDNYHVLSKAILEKDKEKRKQTLSNLIENRTDVNSRNSNGQTALMLAARRGDVECMRLLLEAGAEPNQLNCNGGTALTDAARNGHVVCLRSLLDDGADVNQSNEVGESALMKASSSYRVECVQVLLQAGANVNDIDMRGETALICCMDFYGYRTLWVDETKACLKLLINAGADIDARNYTNLQPIHYALKIWPNFNFPAEYLISENCNFSQASYDQIDASFYDRSLHKEAERINVLKLLFACGFPRHLYQSFIVEHDTFIKHWIETVAYQPNTLKSLCVFEIRRNLGLGIKSKVSKLNLPNVMQNLILLKGILSLECFK